MAHPAIIGVSRITDKNNQLSAPELFAKCIESAILDFVKDEDSVRRLKESITDVVTVRMVLDDIFLAKKGPQFKNLAHQVAKMTGLKNVKRFFGTTSGGNTPQMIVNMFSEKILKGEAECVVIVGGECLQTFQKVLSENIL